MFYKINPQPSPPNLSNFMKTVDQEDFIQLKFNVCHLTVTDPGAYESWTENVIMKTNLRPFIIESLPAWVEAEQEFALGRHIRNVFVLTASM